MVDYYLKDEERFGPFLSFLYRFAGKFPICKMVYNFVEDDVRKSGARVILDIGTGPGDIPIRLAEDGELKIFATDPSRDMIAIARKKAMGIKNLKFALGSSRCVPFRTKFDLIYSSLSYHHWKRKEESLNYLSKFLVNGGEIRIYEYNMRKLHGFMGMGRSHALDIREFRKTVKRTGLKIISVHESGRFVRMSLKRRA